MDSEEEGEEYEEYEEYEEEYVTTEVSSASVPTLLWTRNRL